jgi:hypothetical protein
MVELLELIVAVNIHAQTAVRKKRVVIAVAVAKGRA